MRKIIPYGLRNIGPVSLGWLRDAGITSRADLIRLGAVEAFLRVKARQSRASLNLLWALAGAERGVAWNRLTEDTRERLLRELDAAVDLKDPASKDKQSAKGKSKRKAARKTSKPTSKSKTKPKQAPARKSKKKG